MKHLLIVGAGGFGREMFGAAREAVGYGMEFDIKGFIDARLDALAAFEGYPPVVGTPLVCIRTHAWEWAASESKNGVGEG